MMLPQTRPTRQYLESALQARRLDRTLTTRLPWLDPRDEYAIGPTGIAALDGQLGGGFPRGQLSEIVGARSSGRTSVLIQMIASFTRRGELVALIDALDMLDVESAVAAGVDLDRLLWVRGLVSSAERCDAANDRALNQVIKALTLVLQAGNFGLVACDLGEAPVELLQRLPSTTWLRLQRMVEGGPVCVLAATHPMARSAAGLTLRLEIRGAARTSPATGSLGSAAARHDTGADARLRQGDVSAEARATSPSGGWRVPAARDEIGVGGAGLRFGPRAFEGFDIETRVIRARARGYEGASATLSTTALLHA
jgi:hypothetical protein